MNNPQSTPVSGKPVSQASGNRGAVAAALSLLCMGLGQLYNGQRMKGLILILLNAVGWFVMTTKLPHAIWGVSTLGDKAAHLEKVGKVFKNVPGDHSIYLLVQGLIVLMIVFVYLLIYAFNIRDAYRNGKRLDQGEPVNTFAETLKYVRDFQFPYVVLFPPLFLVLFFTVMPIVFMILLAFTNFSSPEHVPPRNLVDWVGFQAFIDLFQIKKWAHTLYGVATWTLIWAILATVTTFGIGFAVALLVQQDGIRAKTFWRTLFILPFAIPQFVSLLIMRNMFNGQFGPLNQYLGMLGFGGLPWLTDPFWAKVTVIVVNIWIGYPISMLMIIGILTTIPKDLYEAAEMDGASNIQKFRSITFPSVMFAMAPLLVMAFAGNINNFNLIYLLTNGNPANPDYQYAGHTSILITWLYDLSLGNGKYNFASVIGILIFLIVASFSIWNVRRTRAFKEEGLY